MLEEPCKACNGTGGYGAPPGACKQCKSCDGTGRKGGNPLLRKGSAESLTFELKEVESTLRIAKAHVSELMRRRSSLRRRLEKLVNRK